MLLLGMGGRMMDIYNVTIEYLGLKKHDKFPMSTICLGKDGAFLVADSTSLSTPLLCHHCGWAGTDDDDGKMTWDRNTNGVRIDHAVKWTCPACKMVVHHDDE